MRVGVFGGQFDPPHVGHLIVCQEAGFRLALDRLVVVPAGLPPHRAASPRPPEARFRLAAAAFAGEPGIEVSRLEVDQPGPAYTADTLERLAPLGELFLVIGSDQYATLGRWHEPERVRRLATIVVAMRPGSPPPGPDVVLLQSPALDVSSSDLRRRLRRGEPVRHLIPDAVLELLERDRGYDWDAC